MRKIINWLRCLLFSKTTISTTEITIGPDVEPPTNELVWVVGYDKNGAPIAEWKE